MLSHTQFRRWLPLWVLLLGVLLMPEQVAAINFGDLRDATSALGTGASKFIGALNTMTWIVFVFLNFILDPNFIFDLGDAANAGTIGEAGNEGPFMEMLNGIWQLSRDMVNILFALVLLFGAIYTVFTGNREKLREFAPKFVMAVVLVNFSWFIPRMVLDIANITAATVYSIPSVLKSDCRVPFSEDKAGRSCEQEGEKFNCKCIIVVNAKIFPDEEDYDDMAADGLVTDGDSPGWHCPLEEVVCVKKEVMGEENIAGHSAILNGLIVNHARLEFLAQVPQSSGEGDKVSDLIKFLIRTLIILAIHIALFFPLLAMLLAFTIRIPVLWLTMAFMPFAFLGLVLDEKFTFGVPKQISEHFVKAAFLPAIVGVPLTIGFILVNAGTKITSAPFTELPIKLLDNISDFWELLWLLIALGVFYTGVFAALQKVGGILAKGSEAIKAFGDSAGRLAIKAPLAAPILPGGQSPLFLAKTFHPRNIEAAISGPQGFKGFMDRIKTNAEGPDNKKSFEKLAQDQKVDNLAHKLTDLKDELAKSNAEASRAKVDNTTERNSATDKAVREIKGQFNVDVRADDLKNNNFQPYERHLEGVASPEDIRKLKDVFKDISTELQKTNAAPPPTNP